MLVYLNSLLKKDVLIFHNGQVLMTYLNDAASYAFNR